MLELRKEQKELLMEQTRLMLDRAGEGMSTRDIMAHIYVEGLDGKTLEQGRMMADAIIESVTAFDSQYAQACSNMSDWLEDSLKRGIFMGTEVSILGPVPAPVMKINNRYHYRLTVCCRSTRQIRELIAHLMREMMKNQKFRDVSVFADCNPCE